MKLTFLGCGNSTGVPAIGNYWGACDPNEPKNHRLRPSILIQTPRTNLLIDTGPDLRAQLNRAEISRIDGVLYTHTHADHCGGIDELRVLAGRQKQRIPVYGSAETIDLLQKRFDYLFEGNGALYPAAIEANIIGALETYRHGDIAFTPIELDHGTCMSLGYRFGNTAYCTDVWRLDRKAIEALKGIKNLIIDSAGYKSPTNPAHAHLEAIYAWNEQVGAENVYLTSLSLQMDYQTLLAELPQGYTPAYDGLTLNINV